MGVLDARANVIADTGDELERFTGEFDPDTFNTNNTPEDDGSFPIEQHSDNKGPEPEGVDTGEIDGNPYAFLSNERQGGIFANDMSASSGDPRMAGYVNTREDDLGPEGLLFVSAKDSPNRRPLLLSTNEITGTLSIIEVRSSDDGGEEPAPDPDPDGDDGDEDEGDDEDQDDARRGIVDRVFAFLEQIFGGFLRA